MTKRFTPKKIINYLIKEFSISLLIFFLIFLSLIVISTYIEEIIFFREKDLSGNFFLKTLILSLIKTPTLIINISPFIFLFAGIFFFAKLLRSNEITPLSLSGLSKNFVTIVPACFSFFCGLIIIIILSPISSEFSKYYETIKQKYTNNDNLIIMSNTGIWVKEKQNDKTIIIRADRIVDQNFDKLSNVTIYKFDNNNSLLERIDSRKVLVEEKYWRIINPKKILEKEKISNDIIFNTSINFLNLKEFFSNADVFSIWNISKELENIRSRGYYGQDLIITLNKYLSLPFLLFSMIILATFFTLKIGFKFNNFIYAFFGILAGIIVYFLSDLSIAIGKSGKIPLIFSVWVPVIIILLLSFYNLLKQDD